MQVNDNCGLLFIFNLFATIKVINPFSPPRANVMCELLSTFDNFFSTFLWLICLFIRYVSVFCSKLHSQRIGLKKSSIKITKWMIKVLDINLMTQLHLFKSRFSVPLIFIHFKVHSKKDIRALQLHVLKNDFPNLIMKRVRSEKTISRQFTQIFCFSQFSPRY